MGVELQVESKKENIKNAVTSDQKKSVDDFVKSLNNAKENKENEIKNKYKTEIKDAKTNNVNENIQKTIKENYEKTQTTETQKAIIDAFISNSQNIIHAITNNITNDFNNIEKTKGHDLAPFIEAKNAFQTDINTFKIANKEYTNKFTDIEKSIQNLQDQIDLKQIEKTPNYINTLDKGRLTNLNTLTTSKPEIQKKINDKITELNKNETTKATIELNKNRTYELAKTFFESNEDSFNTTFDGIKGIANENIDTYRNPNDKIQEDKVKKFVDMIKIYAQDKEISNISLRSATPTEKYRDGTKIITFNQKVILTPAENGKPAVEKIVSKDIIFGTQNQMQANKAEKFNIKDIDLSKNDPLAQFDGNGNYKTLEKYIKANPEKFDINFKNVANAILTYQNKTTKNDKGETIKEITETSDSYENLTDLKNGYANILTEHVINNPTSMKIYMTYLVKGKADILGGDEVTRMANLQKLKNSPTFMTEFNNLSNDQKTLMGEFMRDEITKEKKISIMEALVKLMTMFGFGKGKLKKRFPSMADKINGIYSEQFRLKDTKEKEVIGEITKGSGLGTESLGRRIKKNDNTEEYTPPKGAEIQEKFTTEKDGIVDKIITEEKYYKWIDPAIIQQGIKLYNEDKTKTTTTKFQESDFITNKEINKNINKENLKTILKAVVNNIGTFDAIAKANNNIQKISTDSEKKLYSEYFDKSGESDKYAIDTKEDIGRYLVTYLFTGSKDLAYTTTENNINNGKIDTPVIKKSETKTEPEKTLTFKDKYTKDGVVTADRAKMRIDEVLDYTTAPDILLFTPRGKTARKIEKAKDILLKDNKTKVNTYVYTDGNNKGKRVPINVGDKIEAEKTETQEEKALNEKGDNITKAIKEIKEGKYKGFDINTYTYSSAPSEGQKAYESDILNPSQEMMEIGANVKQINGKYISDYSALKTHKIFGIEGPIQQDGKDIIPHVKNILIKLGGANKTYENITKNMIAGTQYETGKDDTLTMKNNQGKKIGTLKFGFKEEGTDKKRVLNPIWTEEKAATT